MHLSFLGRPAFALDDRPVALTSGKAVALLAYLAARRVPQSRDHLLDLLWPASSPDAARKNLRNVLWTLRKLMGDDALTAGDDHLAIAPPAWIDLAEFEKAADSPSPAAIELYRGPFLDGVRVLDAPDFEIWLTGERERLARLFLRATATHLHAQRVARNWQGAVDLANRALAQDNLQEPMHRALMEAHARLGQRAEALRQYDALKAILARELGVEPLAETEALRQAIQRGEVGPVSAPALPAPLLFKRQPAASEPYAPAFIGRQAELSALDDALRAAAAGQARRRC